MIQNYTSLKGSIKSIFASPVKNRVVMYFFILINLLSYHRLNAQTTESFNTSPTLISHPSVASWKIHAEVNIGGVVYQISNGGNGGWSFSGNGGVSNSSSLLYSTAATTSVTIKRKDGERFQFYGVWLNYTNFSSYPSPYLSVNYQGSGASSETYGYNKQVTLSKNLNVTSVNMMFSGLHNLNFDNLIVGPAIASPPSVTTSLPSQVAGTIATLGGDVTNDGQGVITDRGVVYSTSPNPTIGDGRAIKENMGTGSGPFAKSVSGLSLSTTYYVRAYTINSAGTAYGSEISFSTTDGTGPLILIPSMDSWIEEGVGHPNDNVNYAGDFYGYYADAVLKFDLSGVSGSVDQAKLRVYVKEKGNDPGIFVKVWGSFEDAWPFNTNTVPSKDISLSGEVPVSASGWIEFDVSSFISNEVAGNQLASFVLSGNTTNGDYWFGIYSESSVTNKPELIITLGSSVELPSLSTNTISGITHNSATSGGNISGDGGAPVTERGLVYSTATGPEIGDGISIKLPSGSGTGSFSQDLTGLSAATSYYVRAYATNSAGTVYGIQETFTTETAVPTGSITITSGASSPAGDWSLENGILTPLTDGANVNFGIVETALANGDLLISAPDDVIIDADIVESLSAIQTLTIKAGRNVVMDPGASVSSTGAGMNLIFWSDADGNEDGMIWLRESASITTNGGHLWMGGGDGTATWNGLTVGDGYAQARRVLSSVEILRINNQPDAHQNGIVLEKTSIKAGEGDVLIKGKVSGIPSDESTGYGQIGVYVLRGTSVNTTSGNINISGISESNRPNESWFWGTLLASDRTTEPNIIQSMSGTITIEGTASQTFAGNHSGGLGIFEWSVAGTGLNEIRSIGGAINLFGYNKNTSHGSYGGIAGLNGGLASKKIYSQTGNITLSGKSEDPTKFGINLNTDIRIGFDGVNPYSGNIILKSDRISSLNTASRIASTGVLTLETQNLDTTIGIGESVVGTLQVPSSYFSTNFVDGFSEIVIGGDKTGLITVESTLDYQDPLTIKTNGNIFFSADANLSSPEANSLTLWTRAQGTNEANDNNNGAIWMPQGSIINTAGGDLTMGGGSDPKVGYAMGDGSASSSENNARFRGLALNGNIDAGGGNIILNGKGASNITHTRGVSIGGLLKTTGTGSITVRGIGKGASDAIALGDSFFTPNAIGILETATGNIILDGKPSSSIRNGINVSTSGSFIKTNGNFSAVSTGRFSATAGALEIGGNTSLEATDNITLTHVSNDFGGSMAVNSAANLLITDQNELTLGAVSASWMIDVATLSGDLILTGNVTTSSSSTDAIILNAGKSESIGTETGGDIIVSGSPTITTGPTGIAKLFSGSEPNSTGLTDLVGGSANVRKEVDETTMTFDPVLVAGNAYAFYRFQDIIQLTIDSRNLPTSKPYDGTNSAVIADIELLGVRSGDDVTVTGEATYDNASTGAGKTITAVYTLGGADAAKYVAPENSVVTNAEIVAKELTVSGLIGDDKVYEGNTTATVSGTAILNGVFSGDEVTLEGTPTLTFAASNVGTGITITASGYMISGTDAGNYTLTQPTGMNADITPRTLGITADSDIKVYDGAALTDNGYSITSGVLASGQTITSMTVTGSQTNVGTSTNSPSTAVILDASNNDVTANYDITYVIGTLEVTPAPLTIMAENKSKTYGEANPALSFTYSGLVNGDTQVTIEPDVSTTVTASSSVGTYGIVLDSGSDDNYSITLKSGELEVTKAELTVTADNQSKIYGSKNPDLTFVYSGWVNGEEAIDTAPSIGTSIDNASNVGNYAGAIELTGGEDNNYTFAFESGDFSVTKAELTVTADNQSKVYGSENPELTFVYSGWVNGEEAIDTAPSIGTTIDNASNVGNYAGAIELTGGEDNNYTFAYEAGNYAVTKAEMTVTADNQSKVYGSENPELTFVYSGWVNGEEAIDTAPDIYTKINQATEVGNYPGTIYFSGGEDNNYTFTYAAGDFAVTKAELTVTADNQTKIYGAENPELTFVYSGWVNGEEAIDTAPSIGTTVDNTSNVGTYPGSIELTGGEDNNYTFAYEAGDFAVTKAELTATADNQSKVYGSENPALTFVYSGWVNGEEAIDTAPDIYTKISSETEVGNYPGTIYFNGGEDNNYTFAYAAGDFSVTKAELTVTADNQSKVYGSENPELTFVYSGWVNGEEAIDTAPSTGTTVDNTSNVGTYAGSIELNGGEDNNYYFAFESGDFAVTKAPLTINAEDKQKVYGEANPELTYNFTGLVNSEETIDILPSIQTAAVASSDAGSYVMLLQGAADSNYEISLVEGHLTIHPAPLTILADDKQKVYGMDNPLLTYHYEGLVNGDTEVGLSPQINASSTAESGVGDYPITLAGAEDPNYHIKMVPGTLEVTPKKLEVKAKIGQFKSFGDDDPEFTYLANGFEGKDGYEVMSGHLEREAGESPGTYGIKLGNLDAGKNYQIQFTGYHFEIIEIVVVDVLELAEIHMAWGEAIPTLPATVLVITDRDEIINLPVSWDDSAVKVLASGSYTLKGTLDLGSVHENPENQQAELTLVVDQKPAPSNLLISLAEFEGDAKKSVIAIGDLEVIDPVDDIHLIELPEGLYDNGYFEISTGQLYWNSHERAEGKTMFQVLVRVTDRDGNVMDRLLEIKRTRKSVSEIEIYNSFTPNGDGMNDGWGVPDLRYYNNVSIQVFERSGKRVFYTQNPDDRWDGTFEGVDLPVGTYYWTVQVSETGEIRKGMLTILKK